jgi:hypothetical protein
MSTYTSVADPPDPTSLDLPMVQNPDDVITPGISTKRPNQILAEQRAQNDTLYKKYQTSRVQNLTLRQLLADSGDALSCLFKEVLGNQKPVPLSQVVTQNNRLRGWGFMLLAVSASGLLIDAVFGIS